MSDHSNLYYHCYHYIYVYELNTTKYRADFKTSQVIDYNFIVLIQVFFYFLIFFFDGASSKRLKKLIYSFLYYRYILEIK